MLVMPAIDILAGACVRLLQGDYSRVTSYAADPVEVARNFERAGAKRIHVVDLDAARGKGANNRTVIGAIRDAVDVMIELGGGVRSEEDVRQLLDIGVDRLVVGSTFARSPETVAEWVSRYGRRIIAGIDARDGSVRVDGWEAASGLEDIVAAEAARKVGAVSIIYTNIAQDGTLAGPDIDGTLRVAEASGLPVVVSGGISSIDDVRKIVDLGDPRIAGVIVGKALYEGRIDVSEATGLSGGGLSPEEW